MTTKSKVPYRCSFCGKSQEQVRKLIAGQGVYICDECINLCQEIIEEEMLEQPKAKPTVAKLPNPRQITFARRTETIDDMLARHTRWGMQDMQFRIHPEEQQLEICYPEGQAGRRCTGPGGQQILLEDPSGNPIELFQPAER